MKTDFPSKGYILLGEAITRIGRSLSDEWTGEEFVPAVATMAKINKDTQTYLIGWVAGHCINAGNTSTTPKRRTKENPDDGKPLSTSATEQWDQANRIYEEARSLLNEIAQFESIKDGGGHLAKIWNDPKRQIVWEWPADFPLSKDELETLKAEEEEFRAPREAAYKRLDKAARLLQSELCGTPPDCEDAIPALLRYPDKRPDRIDSTSWIGPAGLSRLKRAARDDDRTQSGSNIFIHSQRVESLCSLLAPGKTGHRRPGRPTLAPQTPVPLPKKRGGGLKRGRYYGPLKRYLKWRKDNMDDLDTALLRDLREDARRRLNIDSVKDIPKSRSALDNAIKDALKTLGVNR